MPSVTLSQAVWVSGSLQAAGATVSVSEDFGAHLVQQGLATWVADPYQAGDVAPANFAKDTSGNVTGLVGPDGKQSKFQTPRNALKTVVCGNSIADQSKFNGTYIPTKSIIHWANLLGGSPMRFTRITASTRADVHGVYGYSGQTLATINSDVLAQLVDPVNTAGWLPECVIGCGLLENDIVGGRTVAQMQADFNQWRRMMQTLWPGVMLVVITPLPSFSYNTAAMVLAYQQITEWLESLDDGCSLLVSPGDVYEDPAAPAKPLSGFTDASVHPNTKGASRLGRHLAATLSRITTNWAQPSKARYNNPALSGTGAASGTNVTGTVATSFTVGGSANGTFVATAEQPGQLLAITTGSTAGPALIDIGTSNAGSVTTSDTQISAFMEIEIVSGADVIHQLEVWPRINDGGGNTFRYFMNHQTNDAQPELENGDILTFVVPPMVANIGSISGCNNYIKYNPVIAGGTFSLMVRKQGVIAVV